MPYAKSVLSTAMLTSPARPWCVNHSGVGERKAHEHVLHRNDGRDELCVHTSVNKDIF